MNESKKSKSRSFLNHGQLLVETKEIGRIFVSNLSIANFYFLNNIK